MVGRGFASVSHAPDLASDATWAELKRIASDPQFVAVGEIGLDYAKCPIAPEVQQRAFRQALDLAIEVDKPVVIHCRDAYADLMPVLRAYANAFKKMHPSSPGVVHCFSGDQSAAEELIAADFYLGIDGPLTYPNAHALRKIIQHVPAETFGQLRPTARIASTAIASRHNSTQRTVAHCRGRQRVGDAERTKFGIYFQSTSSKFASTLPTEVTFPSAPRPFVTGLFLETNLKCTYVFQRDCASSIIASFERRVDVCTTRIKPIHDERFLFPSRHRPLIAAINPSKIPLRQAAPSLPKKKNRRRMNLHPSAPPFISHLESFTRSVEVQREPRQRLEKGANRKRNSPPPTKSAPAAAPWRDCNWETDRKFCCFKIRRPRWKIYRPSRKRSNC